MVDLVLWLDHCSAFGFQSLVLGSQIYLSLNIGISLSDKAKSFDK